MDPITSDVLERLARRRRFAVRSLDVARRLLIDRAPAREVAAEFGLHLSRVYAIGQQVRAAAQAMLRSGGPGLDEPSIRPPSGVRPVARRVPTDRTGRGRYG